MRRWAALLGVVLVVGIAVVLLRRNTGVHRSKTLIKVPSTQTSTATSSGATGASGASGTAGASGVYTGQAADTQYGPVQVAIDVSAGRIVDVKAVQYPVDRPRSLFINSQAVPLLRSEALQAQSARIDLISGASFTSDGFAASLQSAISQEG